MEGLQNPSVQACIIWHLCSALKAQCKSNYICSLDLSSSLFIVWEYLSYNSYHGNSNIWCASSLEILKEQNLIRQEWVPPWVQTGEYKEPLQAQQLPTPVPKKAENTVHLQTMESLLEPVDIWYKDYKE